MNLNKISARNFGILFLLAFVAYALGNGLLESVTSSAEGFSNVYANKTLLVFGALLMAILHTFANIGLAVIMVPILKPYNNRLPMDILVPQ